MKQISLILFLFFFSAVSLFSQENKEKNMITGGTFGFSYDKNASSGNSQIVISPNRGEFTLTSFSVNPYLGKYLSPQVILGFSAGYNLNISKLGDDKFTDSAYSLGLFARFLLNPDQKLVFQIEPSTLFQYTTSKSDASFTGPDDKLKLLAGGIRAVPLLAYRLSPSVNLIGRFGSLQFLTGYWQFGTSDEKNNFTQFGLSFNSSTILFGVEVNL